MRQLWILRIGEKMNQRRLMSKGIGLFFVLMVLTIFLLGCAPSPVNPAEPAVMEETRIIHSQNFTLAGFWKIEQRFVVDESKSTENNTEEIEVPVPKEKYKEFKEWCGDKETKQQFFEGLGITPGQTQDYGEGSTVTAYPPLSIIPSPALPSGFVPNGVCYFHRVEEIPGEGKVSSLMEMSLQGIAFLENETFILIKEPEHSYNFNFTTQKLELITGYFENEGDTQQKAMRTILSPSTQAAAQADGWPYYNFN